MSLAPYLLFVQDEQPSETFQFPDLRETMEQLAGMSETHGIHFVVTAQNLTRLHPPILGMMGSADEMMGQPVWEPHPMDTRFSLFGERDLGWWADRDGLAV